MVALVPMARVVVCVGVACTPVHVLQTTDMYVWRSYCRMVSNGIGTSKLRQMSLSMLHQWFRAASFIFMISA